MSFERQASPRSISQRPADNHVAPKRIAVITTCLGLPRGRQEVVNLVSSCTNVTFRAELVDDTPNAGYTEGVPLDEHLSVFPRKYYS
jgi:hypothetical protein